MDFTHPLKNKADAAPRSPGVYIMTDEPGKVIYVGKANDLKSRIASYFSGQDTRPMTPFLMSRAFDLTWITTATAKEALILENNLIKKHRPRYNVILRDDKTYYSLSIDPTEAFPRLQLARKRQNPKALYFGPYPSGLAAKETLRFILKVFPLRTCRNTVFKLRARPCLEYQMGRCLAPCKGLIDESAYRKLVESAVSFLQGRRRELISELRRQMEQAADALNFEEAATLRDRIAALEHVLERQSVDAAARPDTDVFGIHADNGTYGLYLLLVREGKILGSKSFLPMHHREDLPAVVSATLIQHYDAESFIPDEILIPCALPDADVIAQWLADKKGHGVILSSPQRGAKKALLEMACANARELLASARKKDQSQDEALALLQEKLSLSKRPRRMECYDISNLSGKHAVGSQVAFDRGHPDKSGYRRYKIRLGDTPDDYGMMREVLTRRLSGKDPLPDLIVVDGGKGQLGVALSVMKELGVSLDVVGLAKEERTFVAAARKAKGKTAASEDRVYLPHRKDAVYLTKYPAALALLQRLRDEAHRFAISYHRKVKLKYDLRSALDAIPDIGPGRRAMLLKHFGSAARVRKASVTQLQKAPGIGKELAEKIHAALSA